MRWEVFENLHLVNREPGRENLRDDVGQFSVLINQRHNIKLAEAAVSVFG